MNEAFGMNIASFYRKASFKAPILRNTQCRAGAFGHRGRTFAGRSTA
jgi:hypothetical protein